MNRNRSEDRTSDEVILVQRVIGHAVGAFGRLYDMRGDRIYGH